MKKTQIILMLIVVASITAIVSAFGDFSTYETFETAAKKPNKEFYVEGYLQKDKEMNNNDPNYFIFYAKDKAGIIHKVILNEGKPRDIEKSEKIVMIGHEDNGVFYCKHVNLKCPSKYTDREKQVNGTKY